MHLTTLKYNFSKAFLLLADVAGKISHFTNGRWTNKKVVSDRQAQAILSNFYVIPIFN